MQTEEFNVKKYWEKRLTNKFDVQGVGYESLTKGYNEWLYRVRKKVFMRLVKRYGLKHSQHVLDVGSGTGFYINLWEELEAKKIVGIDITDLAVSNLSDRFKAHTFYQIDIGEQIPTRLKKSGPFDVVSAMDVLFHITDDAKFERALKNIHDLLETNGIFIWSDNFLHLNEIRSEHIIHRNLFDIETILRNVGFSILERKPMFVIMNEPVDSTSYKYLQLWKFIRKVAGYKNFLGVLLGGVLYPLEFVLTSLLTESPTTEIMVCQK